MQLLPTHNERGAEMTASDPLTDSTHLYCRMQNRLGALDRVLGALTHRGIIPERMVSAVAENNTLALMFTYARQDEKVTEKLLKFLQKQIYVLEAHTVQPEADAKGNGEASKITPLFVSDVIHDYAQRRMAHANNA